MSQKKGQKEDSGIGRIFIVLFMIAMMALFLWGETVCFEQAFRTRTQFSVRSGEISGITVGTTPLEEYVIVCDAKSRPAAKLLQELISEVCGKKLSLSGSVSGGSGNAKVIRVRSGQENAIHIQNGTIEICAPDALACRDQVCIFANAYLGIAFAGEARQHILTTNPVIVIPETVQEYDEVWMEEREPIICLWKTNTARGVYADQSVSLKSELMSYSDDQLYEYVKMMRYCGFTGIQVTDMCSAWAQYGGYEFVHDRLRFLADAAHSLDMKFTLWVWGAEFDGYGWIDHSVTYRDWNVSAYSREVREAVETFEKYYAIYAQLADCSDRVIMHFNDPGQLESSEDIAYFAKIFREMCLAANPEINFGISCYTYQIDLEQIRAYLGTDLTVYGGIAHQQEDLGPCADFRAWASSMGYPVGVWSWNLIEMEIDQLAEMNVNARLIADCYRLTSAADAVYRPSYWSEMDSYHMANLFSLYCSGQLLQDPAQDPDLLLREIAEAVVGEAYAADLYEVLSILQDARTGQDWSEFRVGCENYLLESGRYPAALLAKRCEAAIPKLEEMIRADLPASRVPLAISVKDLLSMILPHVEQIRQFAEFRLLLDRLEEMYASGSSVGAMQYLLDKNYKSIPEYNTIVGVWGQAEARAQYRLIQKFCEKAGLETPLDAGFQALRKQRLLGEMIVSQKKYTDRCTFPKTVAPHWNLGYGEENVTALVEELLLEGILSQTPEERVYLTDWENYRYDF